MIQSFEVTHDFITILSLILHSCLGDLNWNRGASRPFGLLAQLTTHKTINMDPWFGAG